jgi:hypothetical protein
MKEELFRSLLVHQVFLLTLEQKFRKSLVKRLSNVEKDEQELTFQSLLRRRSGCTNDQNNPFN